MDILKTFDTAYDRMWYKHWDYIYILVDVHGTIFKPSYHNEEKFEFYPNAKEALELLSNMPSVKLILWTSSTPEMIEKFKEVFTRNNIVFDFVNCNSDVQALPTDPKSSDFSNKYYFNVGIDDKFGFEPETDWGEIIKYYYFKFR